MSRKSLIKFRMFLLCRKSGVLVVVFRDWANSFMGVKAFEHVSIIPFDETCTSGILGCGLDLKEGFMSELYVVVVLKGRRVLSESFRSCRGFCASCLRLIGVFGQNTEWNCAFKVLALSTSVV